MLLFDFQSHGESPGEHVTFGFLESLDAKAAVAYVRDRLPGQRVGTIGMSMGAAAGVLAKPPLPVDAMVVEAVYPDLDQAVSDRLAIRLGVVGPVLRPLLTLQVRPRLGFSTNELRPIDRVGQLRMPKLFVAGSEDDRTRIEESQAIFRASAEPKELWIVAGVGHVDFYDRAPGEYEQRVLGFLNTNLR